jgi:Asp-tRNA(Asn)/Glu-tRNA(Gln) amidotransferase A subunit family amidase
MSSSSSEVATLTALEAHGRIVRGELRAVEYAEICLKRIEAVEPRVHAWRVLDRDLILHQAAAADAYRASGRPIGPLHGIPVGIKDIIDTADMPTENGTVIDSGRRPQQDATVVARLRAAGAIIFGKTVTTELAYFTPAETCNPHDPGRTPGGSSSGSAAAVAAAMVPLAIGSQTAGSVIRPASYCGVAGFKPSHGLIPRTGVLTLCRPLDTMGAFARSVEDLALICDVMAGYDPGDTDMRIEAAPKLLELARSKPPLEPSFAFVRQPAWDEAEPYTHEAFAELVAALDGKCDSVDLPDAFSEAAAVHRALMVTGFAHHLRPYYGRGRESLGPKLQAAIEEGRQVLATRYLSALDWCEMLRTGVEQIFERYDAIITPAATGEAPQGLDSTGSPAFNTLWTLLGMPAVNLPLMEGPNGMPLGVQLVGRRGQDGRLLRTARWLMAHLSADSGASP